MRPKGNKNRRRGNPDAGSYVKRLQALVRDMDLSDKPGLPADIPENFQGICRQDDTAVFLQVGRCSGQYLFQ